MKNKVVMIFSILGICVCLNGCMPVTEDTNQTDTNINQTTSSEEDRVKSAIKKYEGISPDQLPERVQMSISEGLEIDAALDVSYELSEYSVDELTLTRHIFNQKECVDDMLDLTGNPKVKSYESQKKDDTLENGKQMEMYNARLVKDGFVQGRDLYLLAVIPDRLLREVATDEQIPHNTIEQVPKNENLKFESSDVICEEMQKFFKKLDIPDMLEPEIFTYSKENLQKWTDEDYRTAKNAGFDEAEEYNLKFTDQDEYYYIRYRQGHNGIPYNYYNNIVSDDTTGTTWNASLTEVTYGTKGIERLKLSGIFKCKSVGEKVGIIPFSDILKKFIDSNASYSDRNKITVKKIGLSYLPVVSDADSLEFNARPIWYFFYDVKAGEDGSERSSTVYDAVTGELYQ